MEKNKKKCSLESHKESEAVLFCLECKIYMCHKCDTHHSELFKNHHQFQLDQEIFTNLCNEKNHSLEYKFFCKSHNKLVCPLCITKFKGEDYGQHTDCDVCPIQDIKFEKMNILKENIKILENLSKNLEESIKELKSIYEEIEKNKEQLKISLQKVFTKLRNNLNDREDELLLNIDKKFNDIFNMEVLKESDKLPNKIKISLEKGKSIDTNLRNNSNVNLLINNCLNIENNVIEINKINLSMKKYKELNKRQIKFSYSEEGIQQISEKIKTFGLISQNSASQIISDDQFIKINEWIGGYNNFILKYNAKVDGCSTDIFHNKCDGINKLNMLY